MPEITDLMRVAQYAKSGGAPADVYNAACRMLNEQERLRVERDDAHSVAEKWFNIAIGDGTVIENVRKYAAELPAVYADALGALLPPRGAESNGDGRTPQTLGATEGQEAVEAHRGSQ